MIHDMHRLLSSECSYPPGVKMFRYGNEGWMRSNGKNRDDKPDVNRWGSKGVSFTDYLSTSSDITAKLVSFYRQCVGTHANGL